MSGKRCPSLSYAIRATNETIWYVDHRSSGPAPNKNPNRSGGMDLVAEPKRNEEFVLHSLHRWRCYEVNETQSQDIISSGEPLFVGNLAGDEFRPGTWSRPRPGEKVG